MFPNSVEALDVVLRACGDDLPAENIFKQVSSVQELELPMLRPGIDRCRKIHPQSAGFAGPAQNL